MRGKDLNRKSTFHEGKSFDHNIAVRLSLFSFPRLKKPVVKEETIPPNGPNVSLMTPSIVVDNPSLRS